MKSQGGGLAQTVTLHPGGMDRENGGISKAKGASAGGKAQRVSGEGHPRQTHASLLLEESETMEHTGHWNRVHLRLETTPDRNTFGKNWR